MLFKKTNVVNEAQVQQTNGSIDNTSVIEVNDEVYDDLLHHQLHH